jgi:CMP-N-acetylneuraminic acid synthetase
MKNTVRKKEKLIAMVPARMGSTRLAMKNLALLGGKPLIYYAVNAAQDSRVFDSVKINSEDILFAKLAKRYGAGFYQRAAEWATSSARSDFVVYDFVKNNPCDIVAWINPTSPLQTGEEIRSVVGYFTKNKLDSLITVKDEQVHCVYKGKPINFKTSEIFARTQDLVPVQPFVYSVMMWRTDIFMRTFEKKGRAFFCGKTGFYPVSRLSGIIIKRKEDFMMAEYLMKAIKNESRYGIRYDRLIGNRKVNI